MDAQQAQGSGRLHLVSVLAVGLVSVTLPRIGFLKFTEFFSLLGAGSAAGSTRQHTLMLRCFWPFVAASLLAFCVALFSIAMSAGDTALTSEKAIYSNAFFVPPISLVRIGVYLLSIASLVHFFSVASRKQVQFALTLAYYVAVFPGALQILRVYSGWHFDVPYFERPDVGPFSGVFDAGYLRVMGFEFEPLAYATSMLVMCCIHAHSKHRIPWLGLLVLAHTYSAGALGGFALALAISRFSMLVRWFVPLYAVVAAIVFSYVYVNFESLVDNLFFLQSVMERLTAVKASVGMFLDHPFGVGLGLYGYFFNLYNTFGYYEATSLDHYPNNDLVMFLAYGGLLYAGAYLYVFQFLLKECRSYWLLVAALALSIQSFTSYLFFNPSMILVAALILARSTPVASTGRGRKMSLKASKRMRAASDDQIHRLSLLGPRVTRGASPISGAKTAL